MNSSRRNTHHRHPVRTLLAAAASALAFSVACDTSVDVPIVTSGAPVSLANDVQPIFSAKCSSCHAVGSFANISGINMLLTPGNVIATAVNQPSSQNAAFTIIEPGDADASLLFLKVSQSNPPVGSRMPLIGAALTGEELGLVRDWINQGALDN